MRQDLAEAKRCLNLLYQEMGAGLHIPMLSPVEQRVVQHARNMVDLMALIIQVLEDRDAGGN